MNPQWNAQQPIGASEALVSVMDMISIMSYKQLDVLEFLSSENFEHPVMKDCGFIWLFLHSLTPRHSHRVADLNMINRAITEDNLPL